MLPGVFVRLSDSPDRRGLEPGRRRVHQGISRFVTRYMNRYGRAA
ncbi:hypothetical protein [Halomonas shantousis]